MLIILDDVLELTELLTIQEYFSVDLNRDMHWVPSTYSGIAEFRSPMSALLQVTNKYVDLSMMQGAEYWSHFGTKPEWHIDKDEVLCRRTGEVKTPICSIVYYAKVEALIGGKFLTETEQVTPVQNRMIIFSPNILHGVETYEGYRMSVAINPWTYCPENYRGLNA